MGIGKYFSGWSLPWGQKKSEPLPVEKTEAEKFQEKVTISLREARTLKQKVRSLVSRTRTNLKIDPETNKTTLSSRKFDKALEKINKWLVETKIDDKSMRDYLDEGIKNLQATLAELKAKFQELRSGLDKRASKSVEKSLATMKTVIDDILKNSTLVAKWLGSELTEVKVLKDEVKTPKPKAKNIEEEFAELDTGLSDDLNIDLSKIPDTKEGRILKAIAEITTNSELLMDLSFGEDIKHPKSSELKTLAKRYADLGLDSSLDARMIEYETYDI